MREERTRVLLLCGGEVTEPLYFRGLKHRYRNPAVKVVKNGGKDPVKLARQAADQRHQEAFDEAWCVVDVDEFDIDAAIAEGQRLDVNFAVSNPCFEYWLLLHFESCDAPLTGYRDVKHRLTKQVPEYSKKTLNFADYADCVDGAVDRAKRRCGDITRAHLLNPSSGVWALVEQLGST